MIRRISYTLSILFTLAFVSSCSTMDDMLDEKQDDATLTVKIAQQDPTTVVTRTISDAIENVNVLVFDAQGHLIGSAYASSSPTSVSVPVRVSSGCTICAIANTGSSSYFAGISTLTELKAKVTPVIVSADVLGAKSNEILYGTISGVTLSSGANTQAVTLRRLYSKYTFTITPSSDIAITGYQLCNVPNECYIASGNTTNPTTGFAGLSFGAVATPVYAGTVVPVGPYYIYENLSGTNPTLTTAEQRTSVNAPIGSSYLLITARGTGYNGGWTSTYRVYLGGVTNAASPVVDYTNFNINRDFNYQCNITIAGSSVNDVRVSYSPTTSTRTNVYFGDATVGNYLYNDGTNGTAFKSGQTVGIIYSNELTQTQYNAGCRHGKVLALKNANSGNNCYWANAYNSPYTDHSSTGHPYVTDLKSCYGDISSGYDAMSVNSSYVSTSTNYAWYYCKTYNDGVASKSFVNAPNNVGVWYLPSAGELWDVMENLGTWTAAQKTTLTNMRSSTTGVSNYIIQSPDGTYFNALNSKLSAAGGDQIVPSSGAYYFWCASECNSSYAVYTFFYSSGVGFDDFNKPTYSYYVRAVLAF